MIKTISKKTLDLIIDGIYFICQTYIHWYLKTFIYPNDKKDDNDIGSFDPYV